MIYGPWLALSRFVAGIGKIYVVFRLQRYPLVNGLFFLLSYALWSVGVVESGIWDAMAGGSRKCQDDFQPFGLPSTVRG